MDLKHSPSCLISPTTRVSAGCLPVLPRRQPRNSSRGSVIVCAGGKGFGKSSGGSATKQGGGDDGGDKQQAKRSKSKGKKFMRAGAPAQQLLQQQQQQQADQQQQVIGVPAPSVDEVYRRKAEARQAGEEDPEDQFAARLAALKVEAQQKKKEVQAHKAASAAPKMGSVLDEDIYSNPPPLSQTVFNSSSASSSSSDDDGSGSGGTNQIAAAVGALVLVAIFLAANGSSDLQMAMKPATEQSYTLSDETRSELRKQLAKFDDALQADPADVQSLEGSAVTLATLGEYDKAERQLMKLSEAKPEDPDVWRLLAETRLELGQTSKAVEAYRTAMGKSATPAGVSDGTSGSFELLQGLAAALVEDAKPQLAVNEVQSLLQSSSGREQYGDVELRLLLGQVYGRWRNHGGDAIAVYDDLIKTYPDDFRGYLAKGVLLKQQDRQGDSERMFLQARFLAPKESKSVVDRIIAQL